jgi:preprotein translocase subunit SecD
MLAIVLDGYVNKAPVIEEPILSGEARITLGYGYEETEKEARALSIVLREGALPATLTEATKSVVGPTLGKDSIRQGIEASLIAAVAVVLFMILYYKVSGLFADIALFVNVILLLSLLSVFGATLTLPGIAGIALTVGMAVDANVIINERIREELRRGRTPKSAVENGYKGAMSAVIDSNLTTLISGIVLYQFGTGPIRGFAVTLSIGILTTLFTAIVITKTIFDYRAFRGGIKSLSI